MDCSFLVFFFSYKQLFYLKDKKKVFLFGDINISVNGNHDIFMFTFTFNTFYLRTKSVIILIFYCLLSFTFVIAFYKNSGKTLF